MKICLLIPKNLNENNIKVLKPILSDSRFEIQLAIQDDRPTKTIFQRIKKNFKRKRGGYIFVMILQDVFKRKQVFYDSEEFCFNHRIQFLKTNEPFSDNISDYLKKNDIDVCILLGGFGIIKNPLLSAPNIGILSYHHGNMRKYRGMPPAFWELFNNEKEMGVTVQILVERLDAGIPIIEKAIMIKTNDNWKSLKQRAYDESTTLMYDSLKLLYSNSFKPNNIDKLGKVYTLPNFKQWFSFNMKISTRKIKYLLKKNQ